MNTPGVMLRDVTAVSVFWMMMGRFTHMEKQAKKPLNL
jgi:hypothetical protein